MSQVLARRYAKAFVQVAQESDSPHISLDQFLALSSEILAHPQFLELLGRVTTSVEERVGLLTPLLQAIGAKPEVSSFLRVLAQNGRLGILSGVATAVRDLANKAAGIQVVQVQSAATLTKAEQQRLQNTLSETLKSQVQLQVAEQPELLGGLLIQIGSTVYDGSLRGRMNRLRSELTKE
jgi:F-type H+-transporting ATPase subunit delta